MTPFDAAPGSGAPRAAPNKEAAPNKPEMAKRIGSAVVLAAIAVAAVVASPWSFALLIAGGGVAVAWEWGRLVRGTRFDRIAVLQALAVATVVNGKVHMNIIPIIQVEIDGRPRHVFTFNGKVYKATDR